MPKKVLFCATIDNHFKGFHIPFLKWFKEKGWEVHVAASGNTELPFVDKKFNICIQRSPFKAKNWLAYQQLKSIIEDNHYDIIHCHTPMGGVLSRLAARKERHLGTKVVYTAHGFHFCKGASLTNWLLYYPVEKCLAQLTDCLITINEEDYSIAINHQFPAGRITHVHGVGVNTERFHPIDEKQKIELRKEHGYNSDDFLLFYAAEFNKNKNQQSLLHVLNLLKREMPNAKLLLAGEGPLLDNCRKLATRLGVEKMVDFLGYRNDIVSLLSMCDVAVASSLREGLPLNIMEAMASGLPVVASNNRGHKELVRNDEHGWVLDPSDIKGMADKIRMLRDFELRDKFGKTGRNIVEMTYSLQKVIQEKSHIYSQLMVERNDQLSGQSLKNIAKSG